MNTISRQRLLHLFDVDLERGQLFWRRAPNGKRRAGDMAGCPAKDGGGKIYWVITIDRKIYRRGRLLFFLAHGRWPVPTVDHRDGDSLNDRQKNLREATYSQNSQNRSTHRKASALPRGVSRNAGKSRFKAKVVFQKRDYNLGYFDTPEEAHAAYLAKRKELFGEYA